MKTESLSFLINTVMMKVSFKSNIKQVSEQLRRDINKIESAKQKALGEIAKEAFKEIERKYMVDGDYTKDDRYKPVASGDLSRFQKTRTGQKKLSVGKYFDSKKIISRSGDLLDSIKEIADKVFTEIGTIKNNNYMVRIMKNKIEVWAVSNKAIVLEVKKAGNKGSRSIIRKTFNQAIKIFNRAFKKAMK